MKLILKYLQPVHLSINREFTGIIILIFKAGTWWIIKAIWPAFAEYSVLHFERNFKSLHSLQKVLIYLGFYLSLFYAFVIILAALT